VSPAREIKIQGYMNTSRAHNNKVYPPPPTEGYGRVVRACGTGVRLRGTGVGLDLFTNCATLVSATDTTHHSKGGNREVDPIKRVLEQCRAKEAIFQEEHDGMSSAEYYGESGYSDAQDEAMREREDEEET